STRCGLNACHRYVNVLSYYAVTESPTQGVSRKEFPMANPMSTEDVARIELANRVFFRLYQCANMLHKTGTKAVESEGLTTQQWAVLGALSRPATGGRLAACARRFRRLPCGRHRHRLLGGPGDAAHRATGGVGDRVP